MTTEYFSVKHTAGKTVYFRFFDPSDSTVFDFDDDEWEANLAACADAKLAATEKTDMGDADESLYTASYDLATIYNTAAAKMFIVQAVDDLATDEVIGEDELWVFEGSRINGGLSVTATLTAPTLSVTDDGDGDAVTATVDGDAGVTNTLYYRKDSDTAWTEGTGRSGDGDIAQTGLDDVTHYWFVVISSASGYTSVPSLPVGVFVTSGSTKTYEILAILEPGEYREDYEILATEVQV